MENNLLTLVPSTFRITYKGMTKNIIFYYLSLTKLKKLIIQYYFSNKD